MTKKQTRKSWFRGFKSFLSIFVRRPKVINLGDDLLTNAIYISNHSGATGPVTHELYLDVPFYAWGTNEMCFSVRERWNYLLHVYYHQKKHLNYFLSFLASIFALPATTIFYKGMGILPTYMDARLFPTMKKSMSILKNGNSILIFPEDSSQGYFEELTYYYRGFVMLARLYERSQKEEMPIVAMYLNKKQNTLVIDKPKYLSEFNDMDMTDDEISEWFKDRTNQLNKEYIKNKK